MTRTLAITFVCLAVFVGGCSDDPEPPAPPPATPSDPVESIEPPRTPDALAGELAGSEWIRVSINDAWQLKPGGVVTTSEGLTGSWRAVDANTITVTLNSFFAVTFDEKLSEGVARTKDATQKLVRNNVP